MAETGPMVTPTVILARGAEAARSWVRQGRMRPALARFNWHGLADAAAANARQEAEGLALPLDGYPAPRRAALRAALLAEDPAPPDAAADERAWLARAIDARRWAEASIAAYDLLADRTTPDDGQGYRDSAMHLRAHLMTRIGTMQILERLPFSAIVVLQCAPEELLRRVQDKANGREWNTVDEANRLQNLQAQVAIQYGITCGCPVLVVDSMGTPESFAQHILDVLKQNGIFCDV